MRFFSNMPHATGRVIAGLVLLSPLFAAASTELVYVESVNDELDHAVLIRGDGMAWNVYKGNGCLALTTYVDRYVLVHSPLGFFQKESSVIILPDTGDRCRIDDLWQTGYSDIKPKIRNLETKPLMEQELRLLCQVALADLGYQVWADGLDTEDTQAALESFQEAQGIQVSGRIGPVTVLALAGQLLHGYTEDAGVLAVGEALLLYARNELNCKHSDNIKSIGDNGYYIVTSSDLELSVHERDRRKASHWLEDHRILICGHVLYNFSNGEMVERLME